jgi:hypothetical protein
MATVRQPKPHPNGNQNKAWHPPCGIRYSFRANRPGAPFPLHWRDGNTRRAAAYESETAREKAARALAEKRTEHGADVLTFDPKEWLLWLAFKEAVQGVDPLGVAHEWLAANKKAAEFAATTIAEASARYLDAREKDGVAKATLAHARVDIGRFAQQFGTRTLDIPLTSYHDAYR